MDNVLTNPTDIIEEGWNITHDPYQIDIGFTDLYIDLGAERLIAAEKDSEKIAIEIKSFLAASTIASVVSVRTLLSAETFI